MINNSQHSGRPKCWILRSLLVSALLVAPSQPAAFVVPSSTSRSSSSSSTRRRNTNYYSCLWGGFGVANGYSWKEEAFEIDVTVRVPADTRAKDVKFTPSSTSVDLRLGDTVLLDGSRKLRGRVNLDGTYWVISDPDMGPGDYRQVTVTIEKLIRTPRNDFEVVEYDWKGVFSNDTDEVLEVHYDKPETLNVREYAASLGVDIDNIDMSKVDKTMFSSGLNITQNSLDQLKEEGYIQEITRQADGSEYDQEGNLRRPAKDESSEKETKTATPKPIPFLDTDSPWHQSVPVEHDPATNQTFVQQTRNMTRAAFAKDSSLKKDRESLDREMAADPIDTLTVKRLREILKSQGLKVSGNKKELQDRLRNRVNSLLQGKQGSEDQ